MTTKGTSLSTYDVLARLREKYKAPEYAFFAEVADSTGASARRRADGIAMSLWPSRGLHLSGFEIKVSRSDLLNELKDPSKAEAIAQYCDYWYLVLGSESLILDGELPSTWGLIVPFRNGLKIVKEATKMDAQPFNRRFLASLMRSTHNSDTTQKQIAAAVSKVQNEWYKRGEEHGIRTVGYRLPRVEKELEDLRNVVRQFSEASGVDLTKETWRKDYPVKMGEAVKLILDGGIDTSCERLQIAKSTATKILEDIAVYEAISLKSV